MYQPRKAVGFWVVLFFMVILISSFGFAQDQDDVLVKVNGSLIMLQDFDHLMGRYVDHYKNMYGVDLEAEGMEHQFFQLQDMVIHQLIIDVLILQLVEEEGIIVTDMDVEEHLQEIIKEFPDEETFIMILGQAGFTLEEFKEDLWIQVATEELMNLLLEGETITLEHIEEYFQKNQDLFGGEDEKVHASHILLDTEEKALEVLTYLEEKPFQELAAQYSNCPSGSSGGDLGFFARGQMVPPFEEAAFTIEVGEVSQPVETNFGWHLILVHERIEPILLDFDAIKEEVEFYYLEERKHILINALLEKTMEEAEIEFFDLDG